MKVGFIGLGHVGAKLAANLLRDDITLLVYDRQPEACEVLTQKGAIKSSSAASMAKQVAFLITCLPEPAISREVMVGTGGALKAMKKGSVWMEMSTTSAAEIRLLGTQVKEAGCEILDCPVSGGCHRAGTGNISIFAGGERATFEKAMPLLQYMGRNILHCGSLGSASELKVITNFLATANLLSLSEALTASKKAGIDLGLAYEAIRISSGNSFVHETESQVILNGSRDINFTMGLVEKDLRLFQQMVEQSHCVTRLLPSFLQLIAEGMAQYGKDSWSPQIVGLWEQANAVDVRAEGFPAQIVDHEQPCLGREIRSESPHR